MITYLIVYLIPYNGSLIRKKKNKIKYGLFEKIDVEIFTFKGSFHIRK